MKIPFKVIKAKKGGRKWRVSQSGSNDGSCVSEGARGGWNIEGGYMVINRIDEGDEQASEEETVAIRGFTEIDVSLAPKMN